MTHFHSDHEHYIHFLPCYGQKLPIISFGLFGPFCLFFCTKICIYIKFKPKFNIIFLFLKKVFFVPILGWFSYLVTIALTATPLTVLLHHFCNIEVLWSEVFWPIFINIMTICGHFFPCYGQEWPIISFGLFWPFILFCRQNRYTYIKVKTKFDIFILIFKLCLFFGHFWLFWLFGHNHFHGFAPNLNASPVLQYQIIMF